MWYLVFFSTLARVQYLRYLILVIIASLYLVIGPNSSDQETYALVFTDNCSGNFFSGMEKGYQYYNMLFGYADLCKYEVDISACVFFLLTIPLLHFYLKKYVNGIELFYVITILSFYIVSYQLAYNYRTGMSSILAILCMISFRQGPVVSLLFGFLSITFHVQTFPIVVFFLFWQATPKFKVFLFILGLGLIFALFGFFKGFIFEQGTRYLSSYMGSIRVSSVMYLLIYAFCIYTIKKGSFSEFKIVFIFGLIINTLFFFNSHIAARLSRPIEPLLMIVFYHSLQFLNFKLAKNLRFIISLIPGILFVFIESST